MRVIYMGTPDFSVPALQDIIDAGHEVVMVVTQPDKPKGRGGKVQYTPVKEKALEHGIEVFQPVKIRDEENVRVLKNAAPDIIVVAAFGQILSKEILELPKYGCVNIHASLLPRWRGAAPIQSAVIENDDCSGITIMQMDEGLDTGDILISEEIKLDTKETGGSLHDRLSILGGKLIVKCLALMEDDKISPVPQGEDFTYAKKLDKKMGLIDFGESAKTIECLVRGLDPWPSAYTFYNGKMLKIWKARVENETEKCIENDAPGTIVNITENDIYISTGNAYLVIEELQPEGKKRMKAADYLRGSRMTCGEVLGN